MEKSTTIDCRADCTQELQQNNDYQRKNNKSKLILKQKLQWYAYLDTNIDFDFLLHLALKTFKF